MHDFIGPHRATTPDDFLELALGTPLDLWLGVEGESDEERAAREAAARDIIADDPGMVDRVTALAVQAIGDTMPELLALAPARSVLPACRPARRTRGKGLAA